MSTQSNAERHAQADRIRDRLTVIRGRLARSPRLVEYLRLAGYQMEEKEIARRLDMSRQAVTQHRYKLCQIAQIRPAQIPILAYVLGYRHEIGDFGDTLADRWKAERDLFV